VLKYIRFIRNNQRKISIIAHSQGSAAVLCGMSLNNNFYSNYVDFFTALSPVCKLTSFRSGLTLFGIHSNINYLLELIQFYSVAHRNDKHIIFKKKIFDVSMKKWFFILVVFQVNYVLGQSWDISRPVNPLDGIYRLAFQKADSSDACMFPQVFGIDRQYLMGQNDSIGMNGFTIIPSVSLASGLSRLNNQFQGFHQTVGQLDFYSKYKNKLAVQLSYYHLLSDLPQTIATSVASDNTILGWGKALGDFAGLYRTQTWTGKLTYHPNRHVSLEVGRGKLFFGDGYRSLVISHNATAMPYGRMVADLGPFRFNAQWAQLKDNSLGWDQLRTKYIGMHSLTYEATKKLTFTLYEMVIWQKSDRTSARNFDMHYLNPIAFWRPIEYAQGSADNSLLGLNMSYVYKQKCKFYFQFLLNQYFFDGGFIA
jgi:hypothetical protein